MTPLGLGNDLGGSMRVPAQMCGIASIRPSRGRVANHAVTQPWPEPLAIQRANCQGPMARHVADLRLALGIISAPDARDPRWVPVPWDATPSGQRLRVAVARNPAGAGVDPLVSAGLERAAGWLSDAGYDVVDAEPPRILDAAQAWFDTMATAVGVTWPMMEPVAGPDQRAFVTKCLEHGVFHPLEPGAELKLWMTTYELASAWSEFQRDHPIVLSPVCSEGPWLVGEDISRIEELRVAMRMVLSVNVLGLPGCVVPVGCDGGLPQAVQLIGPRFGEHALLDAADTIEKRAPVITPIEPRPVRAA
jgi:amidase